MHLLFFKTAEKFRNFQVFGADSIQGRENAMEDMIPSFEKP